MSEAPIRLTELIAELRRELAEAQLQGQGLSPRLRIDEAEIELQVVLSREGDTGVGLKFWVLNADLKDKYGDATTQKIKLKLKPVSEDSGDFTIAAEESAPRSQAARKASPRANPARPGVGIRAAE